MGQTLILLYIITFVILALNGYYFKRLRLVEGEVKEIKRKNKELISDMHEIKCRD
ncbi:hypothetical protein IPdc08_01028 [archaeon]|nr:hypothetical protein IPdc08_01028 [archaeon]